MNVIRLMSVARYEHTNKYEVEMKGIEQFPLSSGDNDKNWNIGMTFTEVFLQIEMNTVFHFSRENVENYKTVRIVYAILNIWWNAFHNPVKWAADI